MKIKLGINETPFSGYINIDPLPKETPSECEIVVGDPRVSVGVAENNEAIEILAPNMLNYIHHTEVANFITSWVGKLRHGGKIILGGVDGYEIAKKYARKEINTMEYNTLAYGPAKSAWAYYLGTVSLNDITELLEHLGLKILKREVVGLQFIVVGVRE